MKTRQGFVSNSSSSSFIIRTEKTTWDVAKQMLRQRVEWEIRDGDEPAIDCEERIKQIENLNLPIDTPFTMHSCQYETYIFKQGGKVYIDTCNNVGWDLDIPGEYIRGDEHDGDGLYEFDYSKELFFHIDYMIVAKEAPYEDRRAKTCKHYSQLQLADGSIICPECEPPVPITPFQIEVTPKLNRIDFID